MAQAKLTLQQGAFLVRLRSLGNDDANRNAMKRDLFAMVKQQFGIPDDHKLKVEVDTASDPAFLTLIRKKDGTAYELGPDGKWNGNAALAPAPQSTEYIVYVGFRKSASTPQEAVDWVLEDLDINDVDVVMTPAFEQLDAAHPTVLLANKLH